MSFQFNEQKLNLIESEIKKLEDSVSNKISKKELKENPFLVKVNEKIIEKQKNKYNEKVQQLELIHKLNNYLEKNYNDSVDKNEKEKIIFQQQKLNKLRLNLQAEIKKYLNNV